MRPKERRDSGQKDLFRARLDQIVDMDHALAKLGRAVDWRFLETRFGAVYCDGPGQPPLPTRLMAGLAILKHLHDLSDEVLFERWIENPYFQLFCSEEFFQHKLAFDRSSLTRWRQRMGEEKLLALIQESLNVATRTGAAKPADFSKVIVDTTVQPMLARWVRDQRQNQRGRKVYSLHAPEVECIGKGKAHRPYEFGVKVSVATTLLRSKGGQLIAHVKALPGNPYDGHTLGVVLPEIEAQIGAGLSRIVADRGYRGHNAPPEHRLKVYISGQKRRVDPSVKRDLRRRAAVEPGIGHLKSEHRMGRNHLAHAFTPDANNAVPAAAGYNFRRLLAWLRRYLRVLFAALAMQSRSPQYSSAT